MPLPSIVDFPLQVVQCGVNIVGFAEMIVVCLAVVGQMRRRRRREREREEMVDEREWCGCCYCQRRKTRQHGLVSVDIQGGDHDAVTVDVAVAHYSKIASSLLSW